MWFFIADCSHLTSVGVQKLVCMVPTSSLLVKADYKKHYHWLNVGIFAKYYFEARVVTRTGYVVIIATLSVTRSRSG